MKNKYLCKLCGSGGFVYPGQPHKCNGQFRKKFKKEAERKGLGEAFVLQRQIPQTLEEFFSM